MKPPPTADALGTRKLVVRGAFLLILGAFVVGNTVGIVNVHRAQESNRSLVRGTLASVELVTRMSHLIDQKRLLVDAHIFEKATETMDRLEHRISDLDRDFTATSSAFKPIAAAAGQVAAWGRLDDEIAAVQAPLQSALDLSRTNDDAAARAIVASLEGRFDTIASIADSLVRRNDADARRVDEQIRRLQHRTVWLLAGLAAAGTALALLIAGRMARLLDRNDRQVRDAMTRLEAEVRERDAFAGRVAHDLRGPLTTITMAASRLAEQQPREASAFAILQRGVGRMETLIADLLSLSRVDAQLPGTVSQTAAIVAALEEDLRPAVANVAGLLRVDVEPVSVRCSAELMRQVLWNLGDNAVKYRNPNTQLAIHVVGRTVGRRYQLRVSDNGCGMSADEARRAFEPLFRGSETRSIPGTGLGLAIVKRIIEANNGTVSVESEPGRGTTFAIELELADERYSTPAQVPPRALG